MHLTRVPTRLSKVLLTLIIASGAVVAPMAPASAAPVPNCFTHYTHVEMLTPPNMYATVSFRILVRNLPLSRGATVYLGLGSPPEGLTTKTVPAGQRSASWAPFISYPGGALYASIYQGNYHVCSGYGTVSGPYVS